MRVVIQRVLNASVSISGTVTAAIGEGLLVLLGICEEDGDEDIEWLVKKIVGLRVFDDAAGVMNIDVRDAGGDILVVSQFTLMASTKKGNRPSYIRAARPEVAIPLYGTSASAPPCRRRWASRSRPAPSAPTCRSPWSTTAP